ncbi:WlaTC/HtrL family glycosyltransferase [Helicobacter saguini]|uniref:Protein YibB n=1 Tax=Helicobacter saguini TaxID=1548018 RepID=A0A6L7DD62_9HELI|nr:WlaTC/HtrL family glycosyltransferase [Helicobacter saguini]MWV69823.1 hypothetical protein [Helicobacter saguini]
MNAKDSNTLIFTPPLEQDSKNIESNFKVSINPTHLQDTQKAQEITIITAFYELTHEFKGRSSQKYIDYFAFNAALKNTFIIYCENAKIAEQIKQIRAKKAPDSITIIIQKSLDSIAPNEYAKIANIFHAQNSLKDSKNHNNIESKVIESSILESNTNKDSNANIESKRNKIPLNALYSYLMYCKSCFILDSITNPLSKNHITRNLLWFDFGFNHGGDGTFYKANEFNFTLTPQDVLQDSKMNIFANGIIDGYNPHILIGGLLYGNTAAWRHFNAQMTKVYNECLSHAIFPDDQGLQMSLYREFPQDFNVLWDTTWFDALFYFMPESIRKNISTRKFTIVKKTLNQKQILKYMQDTHISGSALRKLIRRFKRSTQKRYYEIKILFEKIFQKRF